MALGLSRILDGGTKPTNQTDSSNEITGATPRSYAQTSSEVIPTVNDGKTSGLGLSSVVGSDDLLGKGAVIPGTDIPVTPEMMAGAGSFWTPNVMNSTNPDVVGTASAALQNSLGGFIDPMFRYNPQTQSVGVSFGPDVSDMVADFIPERKTVGGIA
jgi:hypothetical protein